MVNETILAVITAFIISAVMCPIVIPFLHKLKLASRSGRTARRPI